MRALVAVIQDAREKAGGVASGISGGDHMFFDADEYDEIVADESDGEDEVVATAELALVRDQLFMVLQHSCRNFIEMYDKHDLLLTSFRRERIRPSVLKCPRRYCGITSRGLQSFLLHPRVSLQHSLHEMYVKLRKQLSNR